MGKTIDTLVKDIQQVIDNGDGWDATISRYVASELEDTFNQRFQRGERREPSLRLSQLGTPCSRRLWYNLNLPDEGETLQPHTKLKFLYGDILEQLLIGLAIAAGHTVEGVQDTLEVHGIKGHRDCVIDGVTVDIKSASSYSFKKFQEGGLRDNDPFGYISQLSSYVYAGRDSEVESHPTVGAFLVVDKQNGTLCLDKYDFTSEIMRKEEEIANVKAVAARVSPPPRGFEAVPEGKSGNKKLGINCSYCPYKSTCWEFRTFLSSRGPLFLTEVKREPRMMEKK